MVLFIYNKLNNKKKMIEKIISGGQIGADIAALRAAETLGLQTGGAAPVAFMTSKGKNTELGSRYGLVECLTEQMEKKPTLPTQYVIRSKANVLAADGTVAFRCHASPGTDKTIGYCISGNWKTYQDPSVIIRLARPFKPLLIIDLSDIDNRIRDYDRLRNFVIENNIRTLNVCGNRCNKDFPDWEKAVEHFIVFSLGELFY